MPKVLFVINELASLQASQTTADLIAAAVHHAHVWVCGMRDLAVTPSGVSAWAVQVGAGALDEAGIAALRTATATAIEVSTVDGVWVRTNPGRAERTHSAWLELLFQVQMQGVPVLNTPSGLCLAASKLHLGSLPAHTVPETWASDDAARLSIFLDQLDGPAVLKPALGTRGGGVVRISPDSPDRATLLNEAVANGPAILQRYLADAPQGDVRVHIVGGQLFEINGAPCAVRRVPAQGEWRSNVALGGVPTTANLTEAQRDLARTVGPVLREQGLWHVGIDVVGDRIVECNVFSPGGLADASLFGGEPFTAELVSRFFAELATQAH